MKRIFAFLVLSLAACAAFAFSESGSTSFRHQPCTGDPPLMVVTPSCTYQAPCSYGMHYAGDSSTFQVVRLTFQEEGALYNNLEPAGAVAVPQSGSFCTDGSSRYCYRLQMHIISHTDPFSDGVITETLSGYYEQLNNEVDWQGYGGVNFGQSADSISFQVDQSNTGRMIVHAEGLCSWTDGSGFHQNPWERFFQVQLIGWAPGTGTGGDVAPIVKPAHSHPHSHPIVKPT